MLKQPDFYYIGLPRSGSTFMRGYFEGHPQIFTHTKEEQKTFLSNDAVFQSGQFETKCDVPESMKYLEMTEMLSLGAISGPGQRWDEVRLQPGLSFSATGCRVDPAEIARRMKQAFPNIRIIFTLRNQVDWFRTFFRVLIGDLPPRKHRFTDFLTTLVGQILLFSGHYHRTLDAYFGLFGRENVHVNFFEDIRDNETAMLRAMCGFLGVREEPYNPAMRQYHRGPSNAEANLKNMLASVGISSHILRPLRPLVQPVRSWLETKPIGRDPLSADDKKLIRAIFAVSNRHTARLTGRDLAAAGYPW